MPTYKIWHLLTLKGISHLWDHSEIFLRSSWRLILSQSVITELPDFVSSANFEIKLGIQSDVDVIYVNYEQDCSKNQTLWDSTSDWSPI